MSAAFVNRTAVVYLLPDWYDAEQRRHCVSGTRIKEDKIAAINVALANYNAEHPVFYEDEMDIHLNPRIGADWPLRGQQKRVVTPDQNKVLSDGRVAQQYGKSELRRWKQ